MSIQIYFWEKEHIQEISNNHDSIKLETIAPGISVFVLMTNTNPVKLWKWWRKKLAVFITCKLSLPVGDNLATTSFRENNIPNLFEINMPNFNKYNSNNIVSRQHSHPSIASPLQGHRTSCFVACSILGNTSKFLSDCKYKSYTAYCLVYSWKNRERYWGLSWIQNVQK